MDQNHIIQLLTLIESIIAKQRQEIERLSALAAQKRRAIILDDVTALQQLVEAEEKLLTGLQELEDMRLSLVGKLEDSSGSGEPLKSVEHLQSLADRLDPALADQLRATMNGFTLAYTEFIAANQENTMLLNDAINHIESVVRVLSGSAGGVTYSHQGEMGDVPMRRYLNKRV